MDADSTTGTGAFPVPRVDKPTNSAAESANTAIDISTFFPFLRMPLELRNMVYRLLVVSPHRIHLDCFLPTQGRCLHRLVICTPLLRVCRQISTEALNVLYGENEFVCDGDCVPPSILKHISQENRLRLRTICITHPCAVRGADLDPEDQDDGDWSVSSGSDSDSNGYDYLDFGFHNHVNNLESGEQMIAPEDVWHDEPGSWRAIFSNLTRLTITLVVDCCSLSESLISQDEGFKQYASRTIKRALRFYDENVPDTVTVRCRVWCSMHRCSCVKKKKKCARIQRYVKEVWLMAS